MVLIAELLALIDTLAVYGLPLFDWQHLALSSIYILWVVLISGGLLCLLRHRLNRLSVVKTALLSYLLILNIAVTTNLLWQKMLLAPQQNADPWQAITNAIIAALLTGIALRYFYLQYQLREQEQAELQARVQALHARIRPHFLFNSLNSIASTISVDPKTAERLVEDLSDLFRASLSDATEIRLAEELELGRHYMNMEQVRLGSRLQVHWQIDESCLECAVPSLILQPLLENAVLHGIQPRIEGGVVSISIRGTEDECQIIVSNPTEDSAQNSGDGLHMALENIRHRLFAIYGEQATLNIEKTNNQYSVRLAVPRRSA
ncbi:MAG: histidine kinase [Pseudomonadales bacterium]